MGEERQRGSTRGGVPGLLRRHLPQVYRYFSLRCQGRALAEDLTADTFSAAVDAFAGPIPDHDTAVGDRGGPPQARRSWRRRARDERRFGLLAGDCDLRDDEPWDVRLTPFQSVAPWTAGRTAPSALTLRYIDDLPVPEVAALLGRTVHATEALLVRARAAFRRLLRGEETRDA